MPNETAYAVILVLRLQQALAAAGLPVQFVALDVGEHAPIEVDLVQVARAVVQEVESAAIGQARGGAVAQAVVGVFDAQELAGPLPVRGAAAVDLLGNEQAARVPFEVHAA